MKKIILLFLFLAIAPAALAASGSIYNSSPEGLLPAGGTADGNSYSSGSGLGDNACGTASGTAYTTDLGFMASSVTFATTTTEPDTTNPTISNLRFDGRSISPGYYINNDATITATVTDAASGINTSTSSIEIDSTSISFADLTGNSSYDASTGNLTYRPSPPFSDGSHTFKITARDNSGNSVSISITFKVDSGKIKVDGPVLNYPNPFDPGDGPTEIAYKLNADADVKVYIFTTTGSLIWKNDYFSGVEGAHAGYNVIPWDGLSNSGQVVENGVYLCQIVSGGKVIGRCKIAVLK